MINIRLTQNNSRRAQWALESHKEKPERQLRQACAEFAALELDDVGTEDEWLLIQNEALHKTETELG